MPIPPPDMDSTILAIYATGIQSWYCFYTRLSFITGFKILLVHKPTQEPAVFPAVLANCSNLTGVELPAPQTPAPR